MLIAWPLAYFATTEWLRNFSYRVDPSADTFLVGGGLALLAALVEVGIQSTRAARMNPVEAIRYE